MSNIRERIEHRRFLNRQTLLSGAIATGISITAGAKIENNIHHEAISAKVPVTRAVDPNHEAYMATATLTPEPTETPELTSTPTALSTSTPESSATEESTETSTATSTPVSTPFPEFPGCEDQTEPGDIAHYDTGLHWIVGDGLQEGRDDVYSLEDGDVLQCFCPPQDEFVEGDEGIQTNWIKTDEGDKEKMPPEVFGFFRVWGPDFGLQQRWYYASGADKPSPTTPNFDCNPEAPTATATDTATPTDTPQPTDTPMPTDTPTATDTPQPTDTPEPTDTPTNVPETATPVSHKVKSATPTRTKTSVPPTKTPKPKPTEVKIPMNVETPQSKPPIEKGFPNTGNPDNKKTNLIYAAMAAVSGLSLTGAGLKFGRGRSQDTRTRIAAALARRK